MPKYIALNRVVLPGGIVEKDATFESDLVPGSQWKPIDKEAKAAVKARDAEVSQPVGADKPDPRVAELAALNEALEAEVKELQVQVDALTAPPPPEEPPAA